MTEPVVNLCNNQNPPLSPEEAFKRFNLFQRQMRGRLGAFCFVLLGMTMGPVPAFGLPPFFFFIAWLGLHWVSRRVFDWCTANWICIMCFFYERVLGIKIRTFGFKDHFKKRSVIIMNHVSHFDWLFFWSVVDRHGDFTFWKVITKDMFRQVPIIGWCMQFSNFLFIKRRWDLDEKEFHDKLFYLNCINSPCQLLLFPEGGDMTKKTKTRSDKYADENGLPRYQYCIHPRTTGFVYVMNALRSGGLDAVYDVTIGYPDALPKTEVEIAKGIMPREVHFHIKSYDDRDLPMDNEQLGQWCRDRWAEKEERLKQFYTNKEFQDSHNEEPSATSENLLSHQSNGTVHSQPCHKSREAFLTKNYFFFWSSVSTIVFINFLMYLLVQTSYGVLYLIVVFVGQLWISVYGGGLDYIMLRYKHWDIQKAFTKMKEEKQKLTVS